RPVLPPDVRHRRPALRQPTVARQVPGPRAPRPHPVPDVGTRRATQDRSHRRTITTRAADHGPRRRSPSTAGQRAVPPPDHRRTAVSPWRGPGSLPLPNPAATAGWTVARLHLVAPPRSPRVELPAQRQLRRPRRTRVHALRRPTSR